MTLQQPGSGVMSMALVTPEGSADVQGSGQPPEAMLVSEGHVATIVIWVAHGDIWPELLLRTVSKSMILLQLGICNDVHGLS